MTSFMGQSNFLTGRGIAEFKHQRSDLSTKAFDANREERRGTEGMIEQVVLEMKILMQEGIIPNFDNPFFSLVPRAGLEPAWESPPEGF